MDQGRPKPDLIIFDCDGVLVDSELLSCRCLSEVLAEFGLALSEEQALELFLGRSTRAIEQHYRDLGQVVPDGFLPRLKSRVLETFSASLEPIPGVGAVISGLAAPFCVASSSDIDRVSLSLDVTGLRAHFGARLYTAQMVRHGKPAPDLFLHAAAQMGAEPARTLVIEDSVSGVQAGRAAGMTVWGFVGGSHYRARDGRAILSAAGADRVFARMSDFWEM
ncbi:HAD superfamily hydrolase (TIGR01509 family) [Bradyrhizobium diazoefficiens]|jgi:HAD superfamily hydrolase (TIGR01509 family)|uniref:Putative hydrolase phosphatase protein n=3 Tax=Bradyrhizobium TaxID=374 RepID=A0A837CIK8_9BRAD|nr:MULTISPECIES: HAD family hydrolase [Bradyrhizobium]MBP1094279.1 HAD superfamily hydrolase (TIGR01509 family) [Bradyrhizobium japonicum]APO54734.1 hydrolase [Bradyrhizobium diazoefficiens]KGJ68761.1 putative hydrolase phosphatase protein [Bradyrhizobium diazoefficiens SEMIA 5080]KOY10163.1 hydrolase [Bradyrhizobium diazoefficiens]MBR0865445.1 HAD family hydrolase [Bradyrhizobium diazoefficiens]